MKWSLYHIFKREMKRLSRQKSARNLFIIIPIVVFLLLGFIYYKGALREVSIAVYDNDNSELSRTYIRSLEASPNLDVNYYMSSEDDLETVFVKNEVQGIFYIPKDFHKEVLKGNAVQVKIYTNSTNIVFGNLLYKSAAEVTQLLSAAVVVKNMAPLGINPDKILGIVMPIDINTKVLANPQYNYVYYLLPGLATVLIQMIMFFAASRAFNNEWKLETYADLYATANGNIISMILGKYLAYMVFGLSLCGFLFAIVFPIFGIPIYGNIGSLLVLLLFFLTVNIFLGFGISLLFKDEIIALDIAIFYNSPAFVFSGFTFPIWAMPWLNSLYAQVIPYTHFLTGFLKIYQLNTPFKFILPEIQKLFIFLIIGVVIIGIGLIVNRKKIFLQPKLSAI
ncbi:ABC-2 type transport system permease protein [Winogradskyella eximia]|jgi:ABC-2 type transport system permease protein|uniref:ABC-2 type transport system permease protein n=1 Tax=Winogradskyella eximia TaxID=262006 RepID=A0A3D9H2B4_9FLAO|nr:ABC transporter permease [Winogradskyella eximia]RED43632.1 ABC-2 type transport system permease protein [Winogradskyella eximia]